MTDTVATADSTNPSQTGGPGIVIAPPAPVNGTATPPVVAETPAAETPPVVEQPKAGEVTPPKVEVVPSNTDEAGVVVYDETGDAGLDMALGFIGKLGIAGTDPIMVAAANGDFSFLEAKLSTMGDEAKGWQQHVALGKQAFERQANAFKETQTKTLTAVHAVAGGAEQWDALIKWAGTVASADEKAALNAMFDAGPIQAQMAARSLKAAYAEATGTTVAPPNPASQVAGVAPTQVQPKSAAGYYAEAQALHRQLGTRMDGSPEYAALKQKYFGR